MQVSVRYIKYPQTGWKLEVECLTFFQVWYVQRSHQRFSHFLTFFNRSTNNLITISLCEQIKITSCAIDTYIHVVWDEYAAMCWTPEQCLTMIMQCIEPSTPKQFNKKNTWKRKKLSGCFLWYIKTHSGTVDFKSDSRDWQKQYKAICL